MFYALVFKLHLDFPNENIWLATQNLKDQNQK